MDVLQQVPLTMATTKAGMSAGTTSTLTTANTSLYCIKGKAYTKAGASNAVTPTTDFLTGAAFVAVAAGYGCVFVVGYDKDGTLRVVQGPQQALDGSTTSGATAKFVLAPQFPIVPDTMCPIGYIVVMVGSAGAAWTFGTSNLTGPPASTGITFVDCMTLPDRPQVA